MKRSQKWMCNLLPILLLVASSCVEKPKDKKNLSQQEESEMVKAPKGIISLGEAKILCDNYEDLRITGIKDFEMARNPEKEFVPTQFIDFDFKTIKKYVRYVERQAKRVKVEPDSLRIYLGNYGKDGKDPNKNTVFLVPTAKIDGKYGGFYIDRDGNAKLVRNYWPKDGTGSQGIQQKSKAGLFPSLNTMFYQNGSLILNHGSGGPPPNGDF